MIGGSGIIQLCITMRRGNCNFAVLILSSSGCNMLLLFLILSTEIIVVVL